MGLVLEVGLLAELEKSGDDALASLEKELDEIARLVRKKGLDDFDEPRDIEPWECEMIGYSGIHYLRRLAANFNFRRELPEPGDETNIDGDEMTEKYYALVEQSEASFMARMHMVAPAEAFVRNFDHLIVHGDDRGFYVPVDFARPIPFESKENGPGWIGSSLRLAAECNLLAEALDLPADATVEDIDEDREGPWQRYWTEAYTCLALREGARRSIATGAALAFV